MSLQATIRANVAAIRAAAPAFMIDTCLIRRKGAEVVVNGENKVTYSAGIETACRLIIRSGSASSNVASQERITAQEQFTGLYRLQLPFATEIDVDDHIEYTDIALDTIRTFEVVFVPPFNEMTGAFVVGLRELK